MQYPRLSLLGLPVMTFVALIILPIVVLAASLIGTFFDGVKSGSKGDFSVAESAFRQILGKSTYFTPASVGIEIIKDVANKRIRRDTAINIFDGMWQTERDNFQLGILSLDEVIGKNKNYAPAYVYRGFAFHRKKRYELAHSSYTKAIGLKKNYIEAYYIRGIANQHMGKYRDAVTDYNKVLQIDAKFAAAYVNRGSSYRGMGKYGKAIANYNKALKLEPNEPETYYNRGLAYRHMIDYKRAIADYTKAITLKPDYSGAYYNRGFVYIAKLKNYPKGCPDWRKACELGMCRNYNIAKKRNLCN